MVRLRGKLKAVRIAVSLTDFDCLGRGTSQKASPEQQC